VPDEAKNTNGKNLHGQVIHQSQDVIGRLAQDLIKLPVVSGALTTLFDARERAARAQELAMSALSVPSTADVERLTRRLRSVSQRLEGLEDGIDTIVDKLDKRPAPAADLDARLSRLEAALDRIESALEAR
jgi:predicted  nucleic acid-binding Zn-ribbon protein